MEDYHSGFGRCGTYWCFIFNALRETIKKTDSSELSILRDSINTLKKEIELTKQNVHTSHVQSAETGDTLYVVRKNDSPCKISRKLFGTESRYKEIEEAMKSHY